MKILDDIANSPYLKDEDKAEIKQWIEEISKDESISSILSGYFDDRRIVGDLLIRVMKNIKKPFMTYEANLIRLIYCALTTDGENVFDKKTKTKMINLR